MNDPREHLEAERLSTADLAARPGRPVDAPPPPDERARFMPPNAAAPAAGETEHRAALFPQEELDHLKTKWTEIQSEFVDEPRRSVEEADSLVASTIQRLAESFASARSGLEGQWQRGSDVSTEDLRMALRRYRSFFDRLLAV